MNRLTAADVRFMGWRGIRNRTMRRRQQVMKLAKAHHDLYHAPLGRRRADCSCPWGPNG